MFQFTSTDIINDSERFASVSDGVQIVKGMKIYTADVTAGNVEVFKRAASDAVNEIGKVTVPATPAIGDIYRLKLYIQLSGSQNSY